MPKKQDPAKPAGHDRQDNSGRQQVTAVLLFALAVLTLCLAVIEGGSLWKALHNGLLGLFGICAALVPIVLGYISVIHSRSAQNGRSGGRFWLCTILVFMICAAFQLFITEYNKDLPFLDALSNSWKAGCEWRSGGAIGLLFGFPLVKLFDLTGAKIILSLLIFVFLMLVTGTTLIGFFRAIFKPVAKTRDTFEEVMTETGQRREEKKKQHINVVLGEGYNRWDLPLEDEKTRRRKKAEEDTEEEPFIGDLTKDFNRKTGAETDDPGDIAKTDPPPIKPTARDPFVPSLPEESTSAYRYPPVTLLDLPKQADLGRVESEQTINAGILVQTLNDFKIATRVIGVFRGPSVTRYELEVDPGIKLSRITALADDITMRLATSGVRIEAPIPNKAAVGIEVPNKVRSIVSLREMIDSAEFSMARSKLTVAIGRDIAGKIILTDLADMPHLLIAGTTNSGKSVCTNSMIQSILYKSSPEDVRLLLVDPKQVEFNVYNGIPHLLVPVVTDARKAAGALGWAVNEMEERYTLFKENHAKDFDSYNQKAVKNYDLASMPKIVIVIDEFADLMMTAASEVEDSVCRLAQKGRAAGIHLVIATQRPSVDVITGVIKANFPSRLALTVASQVDSRTILDSGGADKLLAKGDMLFAPMGHKPTRIQGCFVSEKEVARVVEHLKTEESDYDEGIMQEIEEQAARTVKGKRTVAETEDPDGETDELLNQACEFVIAGSEASVSGIQRRFKVGYARAGRLIDMMEQKGVVGPHEGSKPRKVLISWQQWLEMNMNE